MDPLPALGPDRVHDIATEVCELFQQQIDALQSGLAEAETEQYQKRRVQIQELLAELKALGPGPP